MYLIDPAAHTRRAFLRRSGQLALAGTAMPFALNLAAMGEAAAQTAQDYKALVCVFLYGGNDYANSVVAYDQPSYDAYSAIRGGSTGDGIAIARADLAGTVLQGARADGRDYALHQKMTALADLYNTTGKVAVQLNVGPLTVPLTRTQFFGSNRKLYPIPPKLFSHNDQQSTWQSSSPEGSTVGWGGNLGDYAIEQKQNTDSLFTCMSVAGNAVFLSGDTALQYQVSTGGAIKIASANSNVYNSSSVKSAMATLIQQSSGHLLESAYTEVTKRAIRAEADVTLAIGENTTAKPAFPAGTFKDTGLGRQLAMVARLIRGRSTLGAKRQVFFVSMGGFDLHDNLVAKQPELMQQLSDGLADFHRQMVDQKLENNVTAFTASDFGRTMASNGNGSDHGWGSHHFVVGGAVKGKQLYGTPPVITTTDNKAAAGYENHVGQGRIIPTTSVDQYAATLATWFGVPTADLPAILPNLKNFGVTANGIDYPKNVGFMA
ncbi:MAG: DUF1501 domain-containing protein [Comamonadaceae bacterium]|nr:MAG: DUF1501 domain-containing protein [Comamonadaceae bacterium]